MIGWTTVSTREEALKLSKSLLEERLAVCIQIEGPVDSLYHWEGQLTQDKEHRIVIKFLENKALPIKSWIEDNHPYDTPQWVAARAADVSEAYLRWAHDA